ARHSVDLPEPDGPMTTTTSPRPTVRLMSLSTCRSPKYFCTSLTTTNGSPTATDLRCSTRSSSPGRSSPVAAGRGSVESVIRLTLDDTLRRHRHFGVEFRLRRIDAVPLRIRPC